MTMLVGPAKGVPSLCLVRVRVRDRARAMIRVRARVRVRVREPSLCRRAATSAAPSSLGRLRVSAGSR